MKGPRRSKFALESNSQSSVSSSSSSEEGEEARCSLRRGGDITEELIRKGTTLRQRAKEEDTHFLERITNLSLQNKGIRRVANLEMCPNLRVLFLYGNSIWEIENLSFARNLTHLYLENNEISRIRDLSGLRNLVKLYLDGNRISYLEGLEGCSNLEELHLNNQRLHPGDSLGFDVASMDTLSESLSVLTVSNTNLTELTPLCCLMNLQVFRAGRNHIEDMNQVEQLLEACSLLHEIELQGNPIAELPDYRDTLILRSELLQTIDDKPVKPNQRAFLQAREVRRRNMASRRERATSIRAVHASTLAKHPERLAARDSAESDRISPSPSSPIEQTQFTRNNYLTPSAAPSTYLGGRQRFVSKTPTRRIPKHFRAPSSKRAHSTDPLMRNSFSNFFNVGAMSLQNNMPSKNNKHPL